MTSFVRGTSLLRAAATTQARLQAASLTQWTQCIRKFRSTINRTSSKEPDSAQVSAPQPAGMIESGPIFPDPADPHANPLASLSSEEQQQKSDTWQGEKPGPEARIYVRKVSEKGIAFAKGGRKRSFARVWIREGTGIVIVNGRSWVDYFPRLDQRDKILRPMSLLGVLGRFDISCSVNGGGQTGQAEAIRFSLSRALQNWEPTWRPTLKTDGLLTRDRRIVESKKFGRPKARKSFQWVKR